MNDVLTCRSIRFGRQPYKETIHLEIVNVLLRSMQKVLQTKNYSVSDSNSLETLSRITNMERKGNGVSYTNKPPDLRGQSPREEENDRAI